MSDILEIMAEEFRRDCEAGLYIGPGHGAPAFKDSVLTVDWAEVGAAWSRLRRGYETINMHQRTGDKYPRPMTSELDERMLHQYDLYGAHERWRS